jgi:dihydroflavonol-4-reductase
MVLAVAHGSIPFVPPGSASFCCAREVGRAHVAALTRGVPGERYVLAGADATFEELLDTIAAVCGVSWQRPPGSYAEHCAAAVDTLARAKDTGKRPLVEPYRMRVWSGHYLFDSARAIRDLGYGTPSLAAMVRDAYDWYVAHGFVPARATAAG